MQALHSLIPNLSDMEKRFLLNLAKETIEATTRNLQPPRINESELTTTLLNEGASFVTLKIKNNLRGCIGSIIAHRPLYMDVIENAISSSQNDKRFSPLKEEELENLSISISILSKEQPIFYDNLQDLLNKIVPFEDGLILQNENLTGVFLPSVWEEIPDKNAFLGNLCYKAGFHPSKWNNNIKIFRFRTLLIK